MKLSLRVVGLSCSLLLDANAAIAAEASPFPLGAPCETAATSEAAESPSAAPTVAPPAPKTAAEVAILGHLGVATPVGGAGVSLDVMPVPLLAIHAGVGTNGEGPELEAGLRLRLLLPQSKTNYFTVGSGWSMAHYTGHKRNGLAGFDRVLEEMGEGTLSYAVWQRAHFWNNELGAESRYRHFLARYYAGYAALLNRSAYTCTEGYWPCQPKASNFILYVGFALGYVF